MAATETAAENALDVSVGADNEVRTATVDGALHGQRLDKALVTMAPEFSRSHLQHLLEQGHVQVDGQSAASSSRRVRLGQQLHLELVPTEESQAYRPQPMDLTVLYEDDHLLVLDKPAGLVVHPAPGNWSGTLLNGLLARHVGAAALPRAGIVHRLDKDTSGVMMVGKTLPAVTALVRDIAARDVQRRYLAIAHGWPTEDSFSVDASIGRDPQVRVRMAVMASGKAARTDVQLLARGRTVDEPGHRGSEFCALACKLHSGRTHQIRVHLASRGLPLVADAVYGGRLALAMVRQALHATSLGLAHPITRQALHFECSPPADFAAAWASVAPGVPPVVPVELR